MSDTPGWAVDRALRPDPREAKLPLWIQETLRDLRKSLTEQKALAEDALRRTNPETAQVLLDPYNVHDGIGLPDRTTIRFRPPGQGYLDINIRDGRVTVHAENSLTVHPRVSNGIDMWSAPQ